MTAVLARQFRVFRGPSAVIDTIGPNVLALSGFDGVHTGHQALLARAADEAAERGLPVGAATFDDRQARRNGRLDLPALTGLGERLRLLRESGMQFVVLFPGNPGALGVPDDVFTGRILLGVMQSQLIVIRGGAATRTSSGQSLDIEVLPVVRLPSSSRVSTTRIRDLLSLGDIETVNHVLGRAFEVTATADGIVNHDVRARVPACRVTPATGRYGVVVRFHSGGVQATTETVCTIVTDGSAGAELRLPLDRSIDHGRLRISFVASRPYGAYATTPSGSAERPPA